MSLCPRRTLLAIAAILLVGCVEPSRFSKTRHGNLEVSVEIGESVPAPLYPEIWVDGELLGHVTEHDPVLYLHEGEHEIEVRAPGFLPWKGRISIASLQSHQYVHVTLRRHPEVIRAPAKPVEDPAPADEEAAGSASESGSGIPVGQAPSSGG